ncbi:MAG: hypothetical protein IJI20_06475 [Firmicutes bacterium]|nr:hypothetical protein [Bacillota bacterium]
MIRYRKATMADIPELARIRKIQLQDEGQSPDTDMDRELTDYFEEKMGAGELIEWVAEDEQGGIIATAHRKTGAGGKGQGDHEASTARVPNGQEGIRQDRLCGNGCGHGERHTLTNLEIGGARSFYYHFT